MIPDIHDVSTVSVPNLREFCMRRPDRDFWLETDHLHKLYKDALPRVFLSETLAPRLID